MKKPRIFPPYTFAVFVIVLALASYTAAGVQTKPQASFPKVMTYNIYQGTELQDVLAATTLLQFVLAVSTDYGHVVTNNFPERAQAIAAEVVMAKPDLLGLQEVALWRTGPHTSPPTPATTVAYDYLQILLDALTATGVQYSVLVVRTNFDVQGPGLFPTGLVDVRLTERSAILVRTSDLGITGLSFTNIQSVDYTANTVLQSLVGPVRLSGGFESVDVTVHGFAVARLISTHMDGFSQQVRDAQAQQILSDAANTKIPVIMSGDLNAGPGSSSYNLFVSAGFTDSWPSLNSGDPGNTCCQVRQDGVIVDVINNPTSFLAERVDMVLTRGVFVATSMTIVGADSSTRTASGLWPSDHAGLVATLGLSPNGS